MTIYKGSRYTRTPVTFRETYGFSMRSIHPFNEANATYHMLENNETLDMLSYKYYGTVQYWWAIADANNVIFEADLKAGDKLLIPSLEEIKERI